MCVFTHKYTWDQLVTLAGLVKPFLSKKAKPSLSVLSRAGEFGEGCLGHLYLSWPVLISHYIEPAAVDTNTPHLCSAKLFHCPRGSLAQTTPTRLKVL